jgi:hypothetical protein
MSQSIEESPAELSVSGSRPAIPGSTTERQPSPFKGVHLSISHILGTIVLLTYIIETSIFLGLEPQNALQAGARSE